MYKLILELDGRNYFLTSVNIGKYNRGSEYGQSPADNSLQFQIRTLKMDNFLWNWAASDIVVKKNGKVKLIDATTDALLQTYTFEQGYCTTSNMGFYSTSDASEVSLSLAATKLTVEIHENPISNVLGGRG